MEGGSTETAATETEVDVPLFGARKRARELAAEAATLREQLARIGGLSLIEVEEKKVEISAEIEEQRRELVEERERALSEIEEKSAQAKEALDRDLSEKRSEQSNLDRRLRELTQEVVATEETAMLQEAGVYEYRHPLSDSVKYKDALKGVRERIKEMTRRDGGAVRGTTNWAVNDSVAKGRKMVRDFSKLMLRAYNAEADNLVRGLKPYKLDAAIERLTKVVATIAKLGSTMDIHISGPYHELRVYELELTADYREMLAVEKEREREERERLREEKQAQQEMERERAKLEKERQHYLNSLTKLREKGDVDGVARLEEELQKIERAIEDVDYRAANIRAGYVYVISNLGSFGEGVVKIGLTRRLEPLDRVRELGDASVPFRFDIHALLFSEDAVGIEASLHERLSDRRVNKVNLRREFFYATPAEVKEHLLEVAGELLTFEETAEAAEFHQSKSFTPPPQ